MLARGGLSRSMMTMVVITRLVTAIRERNMCRGRFIAFVVVVVLASLSSGCGESDPLGRRALSGLVTFQGQPLEQGTISFQPTEQGTTSSGAVILQGKYSIPREQGLPVGKYRVVINALKPGTGTTLPDGAMPGEEIGPPPEELIPAEWNVNSQNIIEISESGSNEFRHEILVGQ
jgi:hypothetical protein